MRREGGEFVPSLLVGRDEGIDPDVTPTSALVESRRVHELCGRARIQVDDDR